MWDKLTCLSWDSFCLTCPYPNLCAPNPLFWMGFHVQWGEPILFGCRDAKTNGRIFNKLSHVLSPREALAGATRNYFFALSVHSPWDMNFLEEISVTRNKDQGKQIDHENFSSTNWYFLCAQTINTFTSAVWCWCDPYVGDNKHFFSVTLHASVISSYFRYRFTWGSLLTWKWKRDIVNCLKWSVYVDQFSMEFWLVWHNIIPYN